MGAQGAWSPGPIGGPLPAATPGISPPPPPYSLVACPHLEVVRRLLSWTARQGEGGES